LLSRYGSDAPRPAESPSDGPGTWPRPAGRPVMTKINLSKERGRCLFTARMCLGRVITVREPSGSFSRHGHLIIACESRVNCPRQIGSVKQSASVRHSSARAFQRSARVSGRAAPLILHRVGIAGMIPARERNIVPIAKGYSRVSQTFFDCASQPSGARFQRAGRWCSARNLGHRNLVTKFG